MVRPLSSAVLIAVLVLTAVPQPRTDRARSQPEADDKASVYSGDEREQPGAAMARFLYMAGKDDELTEIWLRRSSRIARSTGNLLLERLYLEHSRAYGGPQAPAHPATTIRLAENAIERNDPATAVRLLTKPGPQGSSSADRRAQEIVARAYLQMRRSDDARRLFTDLIERDASPLTPDDSSYVAARALDEISDGNAQLSPSEHRRRAEIYQFHRDLVPARSHFEAWAANDPASEPAAFLSIGRGYALAGEYGEAVKFYERLLERYPESPEAKDALLRLAGAYSRVGKAKESLARYQSFIEKYPADEMLDRAYLNQVDLLRDEGDVSSALKWCDRTVSTFGGKPPGAVALFSKARIHLTRDEWPEAIAALDSLSRIVDLGGTAIPGGTSTQEVVFLRAVALEKLARYPEAVEAFLSIPDGRNEYYGGLATERLRKMASAERSAASAVSEKADSFAAELAAKERDTRRAAAIGLLRLTTTGDKRDRALSVIKSLGQKDVLNIKPGSPKRPAVDALVRTGAFAEAASLVASRTPEAADAELLIRGNRADMALQLLEPLWNKVASDSPVEVLPRDPLRRLYPVVFSEQVLPAAKKDGVDPRLILSIMRQESRFDTSARSNVGARGLMQFISTTAREVEREVDVPDFELNDLYDPEIAIMFGSRHLADLFHKFPGQTEAVIAAYNAGDDNMSRWLARARSNDPARYVPEIMFTQTKDYVYRVMANLRMYQTLYDEELRPIGDVPTDTAK